MEANLGDPQNLRVVTSNQETAPKKRHRRLRQASSIPMKRRHNQLSVNPAKSPIMKIVSFPEKKADLLSKRADLLPLPKLAARPRRKKEGMRSGEGAALLAKEAGRLWDALEYPQQPGQAGNTDEKRGERVPRAGSRLG